ncbi:15478_t:CDS:2, partial [Cetraspora pellucida]
DILEEFKNDQDILQEFKNVVQEFFKRKKTSRIMGGQSQKGITKIYYGERVGYIPLSATKKLQNLQGSHENKSMDVNKSAERKRKNTDSMDIKVTKKRKKTIEKSDPIKELEEELKPFFKTRSGYSLLSASEEMLQVTVEVLLRHEINNIPQLSLVIDNTKPRGEGRFGMVDFFLEDLVIELKYIKLLGLIKAMKNDYNASPRTKELEALDKVIENEDEKTLLKRQVMYWSKEDKKPMLKTIGDFLSSAEQQVKKYMGAIANGKASSDKPGIIDPRIRQEQTDYSILNGHVIMMIGFRRIISRTILASPK